MKLSEAIQRVGGPTNALQLLWGSSIPAFSKISQSTMFRWIKAEKEMEEANDDKEVLPESAALARDVLANSAVLPVNIEGTVRDDVPAIQDRVLRCVIIMHPAVIPMAMAFAHFKDQIQPPGRSETGLRRLALGVSISVQHTKTATTKQLLQRILNGGADCTIVPMTTFKHFGRKPSRRVVPLCRMAVGPNIVLRRGDREIQPKQTAYIYHERLPSVERYANKLKSTLDAIGVISEPLKPVGPGNLEEVIAGFESAVDQVFFFGTTAFQESIRTGLELRKDLEIYIETNDEFREHSEWYLCIGAEWMHHWEVLRSLLTALKQTSAALKKTSADPLEITGEEFEDCTLVPKENVGVMKDFRFPCDQISSAVIDAWDKR